MTGQLPGPAWTLPGGPARRYQLANSVVSNMYRDAR